jgi:hypothetical protein
MRAFCTTLGIEDLANVFYVGEWQGSDGIPVTTGINGINEPEEYEVLTVRKGDHFVRPDDPPEKHRPHRLSHIIQAPQQLDREAAAYISPEDLARAMGFDAPEDVDADAGEEQDAAPAAEAPEPDYASFEDPEDFNPAGEPEPEPPPRKQRQEETPGYEPTGIPLDEFLARDYRIEWLIRRLLVAGPGCKASGPGSPGKPRGPTIRR